MSVLMECVIAAVILLGGIALGYCLGAKREIRKKFREDARHFYVMAGFCLCMAKAVEDGRYDSATDALRSMATRNVEGWEQSKSNLRPQEIAYLQKTPMGDFVRQHNQNR